MTRHDYTIREDARRHATKVGTASAKARGLDDWDAIALQAAHEAEALYLQRHAHDDPEESDQ